MHNVKKREIIRSCQKLLEAYKTAELGNVIMPEDTSPTFGKNEMEQRLSYFTLPMALNYQRNSYKLWESTLATYKDESTRNVFDVHSAATMPEEILRTKLLKHKIALQPNKHVNTWQKISQTIDVNWGSMINLMDSADNDYTKLREIVQFKYKKGFPYLSGPKIFNYWSFIISTYGKVPLKHRELIEIAPDTHVTKCSVLLNIITETEATKLSKEQIASIWRDILEGSGIAPIDMHPPLWFWSKNNFIYKLD
jgi:hypothetical protein